MLDASRVLEIAERCLEESRQFWGLDPAWQIELELANLEDNTAATCSVEYDYLKAWIKVDPAKCHREADVWQHTAHEVAHIVLAPFDFPRYACSGQLSGEGSAIWLHAEERTTSALERVFIRERPYQ